MPFKFQALWGSKIQTRWSNTAPNMVSEESIFFRFPKSGLHVTSERSWRLPSDEEITVGAHTPNIAKHSDSQASLGEIICLCLFAYNHIIPGVQDFMGVIAISSSTACFFSLVPMCCWDWLVWNHLPRSKQSSSIIPFGIPTGSSCRTYPWTASHLHLVRMKSKRLMKWIDLNPKIWSYWKWICMLVIGSIVKLIVNGVRVISSNSLIDQQT